MKRLKLKNDSIQRLAKPLTILGCLSLAGCTGSTYSSHFDCPYGEGAGCASLSKVNVMIDRGEIDLEDGFTSENAGPASNCSSCVFSNHGLKKKQIYIYHGPEQISKVISIDVLSAG